MRRPIPALIAAASLCLIGLTACSSTGSDGTATKATTTTVVHLPDGMTGPVHGGTYGIPYLAMPAGWAAKYHYTEDEYFLKGSAESYSADGPLSSDGQWSINRSSTSAPFETRLLVRHPVDPKDFNGTVLVEWLNVTAGRDSDPDFGFLADELLREGYAYVGVSAQRTGVEPGGLGIDIPNVPKVALAPLKDWDPKRYGELHHPGDAYSYDIFTQATRAAVAGPLGNLPVRHVIAAGESQSASRMVTYVDAVQPLTDTFDGFLIHSRGGSAGALSDDPSTQPPNDLHIRTDSGVPVLQFETETDLTLLGFVHARQADDDHLATWEPAGTAHVDKSTLDYGVLAAHRWTDQNVDLASVCGSVNDGPQQPLVQAAFAALSRWVTKGTHPPASPRITVDAGGAIVRDDLGIAEGGIRTPDVDAPTTVLTGTNPTDSAICSLFGSSTPLTAAQLTARYADHDAYVAAVTRSADKARDDGFLRPAAAAAMIAAAERADVPPS